MPLAVVALFQFALVLEVTEPTLYAHVSKPCSIADLTSGLTRVASHILKALLHERQSLSALSDLTPGQV